LFSYIQVTLGADDGLPVTRKVGRRIRVMLCKVLVLSLIVVTILLFPTVQNLAA
jgi:hypothetical protein